MSYPSPSELWSLSPTEFNKWRRENDLKSLFENFKKSLPHFEEWLSQNNLSIEQILETNNPGHFFYWDKAVYLVQTTKENNISYFFVPVEDLNHEKQILKVKKTKFENEKSVEHRFLPYLLWVKTVHKIEKPLKTKFSDLETFRYVLSTAPDVPEKCTQVIAPGIEVLKLGGTKITNWVKLNGRNLDFTNLDYLEVTGKHSADRELQIFFSSCKKIMLNDAVAHFTKFYQCEFSGLKVINSRLYGIDFYKCDIFGAYFENSSISNLTINNCSSNNFSFNRVEVEDIYYFPPKSEHHTGIASTYQTITDNYKRFRVLFQSNGLRREASEAYYKERLYEMMYNWKIAQVRRSFSFIWKKNRKFYWFEIERSLSIKMKAFGTFFSYLIWGFGERPIRILSSSFFVFSAYALIYFLSSIDKLHNNLINSYYLSIVTFTTLGFGDITPTTDGYKLIVASEALCGVFFMGLLIAAYANKSKY